jgi:SAM-dependent methyltransferase
MSIVNANTASSLREQVILANRDFYKEIAGKYDRYESCACDQFFQRGIEADLAVIEKGLGDRAQPVRCLDCGGGTGNVTLKMLRRGWRVTVVDVSPEMLAILKEKVSTAGKSAAFVNDSIENFLAQCNEGFDVISFSSVLHHLFSPLAVVRSASERISLGGFFYSVFDPVPPSSKFAAACFGSLDTLLAKLSYDRKDLLPGIYRRLRKTGSAKDAAHGRPVLSPGDLAEYHAHKGLDDHGIAMVLEREGFCVELKRYPVGRTRILRFVNSRVQALLNFRILAQRLSDPQNSALHQSRTQATTQTPSLSV